MKLLKTHLFSFFPPTKRPEFFGFGCSNLPENGFDFLIEASAAPLLLPHSSSRPTLVWRWPNMHHKRHFGQQSHSGRQLSSRFQFSGRIEQHRASAKWENRLCLAVYDAWKLLVHVCIVLDSAVFFTICYISHLVKLETHRFFFFCQKKQLK